MDYNELVNSDLQVLPRAYAPNAKFLVGAALLVKSGKGYVGCNVENISLRLTTCAEQGAAASAIPGGESDFVTIAAAADTIEPIVRCGACRQFPPEFSPDLVIVGATLRGNQEVENLSCLPPDPKRGIPEYVHTP